MCWFLLLFSPSLLSSECVWQYLVWILIVRLLWWFHFPPFLLLLFLVKSLYCFFSQTAINISIAKAISEIISDKIKGWKSFWLLKCSHFILWFSSQTFLATAGTFGNKIEIKSFSLLFFFLTFYAFYPEKFSLEFSIKFFQLQNVNFV